jgi:ABC-type glycerol-3-phosphate transport system substrate-binding protein
LEINVVIKLLNGFYGFKNKVRNNVEVTMSKQMKFGFAGMALAGVLLATVAVLPLRYAEAQNATMSLPQGMVTKEMIQEKIDQMKEEYPELGTALDNIPNLDTDQTLKELIGALELQDVLIAHGKIVLLEKVTGAMQNATASG